MQLQELERLLKDNKQALDNNAHLRKKDVEQRLSKVEEEFKERANARKFSEAFINRIYTL